MQDLGDRRQGWYAQVGLVRAQAASAWASSQEKLGRALVQWRQGFQQEYGEKSEAWRQAYLNMGESKLAWVEATREKAGQAGNEAILSEVGASAEDSSRNAGTLLVSGMSYDAKEATVAVEGLLGEVGSAEALERAEADECRDRVRRSGGGACGVVSRHLGGEDRGRGEEVCSAEQEAHRAALHQYHFDITIPSNSVSHEYRPLNWRL